MSLQDRSYWIEKAKEKVLRNDSEATATVKEIMFLYDESAFEVEARIEAMYQKYSADNQLTSAEARKLISGKEYSVWKKSIDEYVSELVGDGADSRLALELNTLSMKSRISREEKLLADIYKQMAELAKDYEADLTELLSDVTKSNYYRGCYNIQIGAGIGFPVGKISEGVIKQLLEYPWATKTFSRSVWDNIDSICMNARRVITKGFISGQGIKKMTAELDKLMDNGRYNAERLVRTECKYFANQAELLSYKESGIKKYVYMGGGRDGYHCDCAFYNNKIIPVESAVAGDNFPPLHPNCRCCVRPYFANSMLDNNRNYVPIEGSMSLDEWKNEFVVDESKLLPNFENAIIPKEKFTAYCLNPLKAPDKALAFKEALNYSLDNYEGLRENIRVNLANFPAIKKDDNGYGVRYEVLMTLVGTNNRKANVKTGWIIEHESTVPKLTSAYITKKKFKEGEG